MENVHIKFLEKNFGAVNQICTDDLDITNIVLYYLSYNGKKLAPQINSIIRRAVVTKGELLRTL